MPNSYNLLNIEADMICLQFSNFLAFFVLIYLYFHNLLVFFLLILTYSCINLLILTMSVTLSLSFLTKISKSKKVLYKSYKAN